MCGYRRKLVLRSYSGSYVIVYIFTPFRSFRRHLKIGHKQGIKGSGFENVGRTRPCIRAPAQRPHSAGTGTWKKGCVYSSSYN